MKRLLTTYTLILLSVPLLAYNFASTPIKIPAHYVAEKQDLNSVISHLKQNGFSILATTPIFKEYNVVTITNPELQQTNSYMATLQVNVGTKNIHVQNPSYLAAAYLGENYKYGQFKHTTNALKNALGPLTNSSQQADFSTLAHYSFMYGLPTKDDTLSIQKSSKLLEKLSEAKAKKYIAYTLTLPNGSTLVGHKLHGNTNKFLEKLGQAQNAQILPYEAIINGDEVSMMNPKYYLALSLPLLTLEEFMEIASIPDRIYRNIKQAYK